MSDALARADDAQRRAADPEASVFVTANAGSGKTKVLIDRVARLLLRGDNPSAFLCITYTKAAAAEMQRRLFERLGAWCVLGDEALAQELRVLRGVDEPISAQDLSRARALFARALETPGGLKIQTIHSFCERLLRRFPLEAGAPPGFEILDEGGSEKLMARAWADIVSREAPSKALAHLARRLDEDRLDDLINSVNARRRLLRATLHQNGLGAALARLRKRHGATKDRAGFLEEFYARTPWKDLDAAIERLILSGANDVKVADRIVLARSGDHHERFELYRAVFFTGAGEPRANVITKGLRTKDPFLDRLFTAEMSRVVDAHSALKSIDRADDIAALLTLADGLLASYQRGKAAIGALDFEDLIERAEALLNTAGAAPWVLFKLDGGIDHILIDEGQDTSPAQWELLEPLQSEFFAGVGVREKTRTMFAVGDPKQSIYSFQGADSARFLAEAQALSARAAAAEMRFHAPDMTMSFRSTPTVLQAVDAVFEDLALASAEPSASDIVRHDARRNEHVGLVEWWPLAPRPERPETPAWDAPLDSEAVTSSTAIMARAIAAKVSGWIREGALIWDRDHKAPPRPMRPGDVIALVRSRGGVFDALLKAFKAEGLPVAGADRMALNDEIAVLDMLAFARVALDEGDDLSLACALKSPLISLDDDDLMELAAKRGRGERLIDRLRAMPVYRETALFVDAVITARNAQPHDFLARLLEMPGSDGRTGWTRMLERLGVAARDPLEEILSRALTLGRSGPPTLQHFVSLIESDDAPVKREMETGLDAVRVMTAHGAKGLEAPVVILADTTGGFEGGRDSGLLIGEGELFWSPNKDGDDAVTAQVREAARQAAQREHWRLLYVALTRARDRLIVCGHTRGNSKEGRTQGSWHELVEAGMRKIGTPADTPFGEGLRIGEDKSAGAEQKLAAKAIHLPAWAQRNAPPATPPSPTLSPSRLSAREPPAFSARAGERHRFRRGRLIHGLMQRLPDIEPAHREAAAQTWLNGRMAPGEDGAALAAEALAILDDPSFAALFAPGSRAETPIVGEVAGHRVSGIIDRLVVSDREVLILDFKTDRPAPLDPDHIAEPYLAQLALYKALLSKAFPGRLIRCALLWTEAPALMEAPPEALERALQALMS